MWDSVQEFVLDACVYKECAPYVPDARLMGRSVFGYSFICVNYFDSYNIQEIIYMSRVLMWDGSAVCGGITVLKIMVRN